MPRCGECAACLVLPALSVTNPRTRTVSALKATAIAGSLARRRRTTGRSPAAAPGGAVRRDRRYRQASSSPSALPPWNGLTYDESCGGTKRSGPGRTPPVPRRAGDLACQPVRGSLPCFVRERRSSARMRNQRVRSPQVINGLRMALGRISQTSCLLTGSTVPFVGGVPVGGI